MNLDDFEAYISSTILYRGLAYFHEKAVRSLECIDKGHYLAKVMGSQLYEVEVTIDEHREIEAISCTCPYDWDDHCKHEAAVLIALRCLLNASQDTPEEKAEAVDLNPLLQERSREELIAFLLSYAQKDRALASALLAQFPSSDDVHILESLRTRFREVAEDSLHWVSTSYSNDWDEDDEDEDEDDGDWAFTNTLQKTIDEYLAMARTALSFGRFQFAGSICAGMLHEIAGIEVESGSLEELKEGVVEQVVDLFDLEAIPSEDTSPLFSLFFAEVEGYAQKSQALLLSLCIGLAEQEEEQNRLQAYLVHAHEAQDWSGCESSDRYLLLQHQLLLRQKKEEEAQAFALRYLTYDSLRLLAFRHALDKKEYSLAEHLVQEREDSFEHARGALQWKELRFTVYQASGNTEQVRKLAREFLSSGDLTYYPILKNSYSKAEWKAVVDGLLDDLQRSDATSTRQGKTRYFYADVLQEEKQYRRLLSYVQHYPSLVQRYANSLIPTYAEEVFALYIQLVLTQSESVKDRSDYARLASLLTELVALGGEAAANECLETLTPVYRKRPAMKDELRKVGLL